MKIVVKSTKTISFDENFDDDGSSSDNKSHEELEDEKSDPELEDESDRAN